MCIPLKIKRDKISGGQLQANPQSRFARLYRENLDNFMFEMWKHQDRAQLILDDLAANDEFDVPIKERDIFPLGDILADALGPDYWRGCL